MSHLHFCLLKSIWDTQGSVTHDEQPFVCWNLRWVKLQHRQSGREVCNSIC